MRRNLARRTTLRRVISLRAVIGRVTSITDRQAVFRTRRDGEPTGDGSTPAGADPRHAPDAQSFVAGGRARPPALATGRPQGALAHGRVRAGCSSASSSSTTTDDRLFGVDAPARIVVAALMLDRRLAARARPRAGAGADAVPAARSGGGGHGRVHRALRDDGDRGVRRAARRGPGPADARRRRRRHRGRPRPGGAADVRQPDSRARCCSARARSGSASACACRAGRWPGRSRARSARSGCSTRRSPTATTRSWCPTASC